MKNLSPRYLLLSATIIIISNSQAFSRHIQFLVGIQLPLQAIVHMSTHYTPFSISGQLEIGPQYIANTRYHIPYPQKVYESQYGGGLAIEFYPLFFYQSSILQFLYTQLGIQYRRYDVKISTITEDQRISESIYSNPRAVLLNFGLGGNYIWPAGGSIKVNLLFFTTIKTAHQPVDEIEHDPITLTPLPTLSLLFGYSFL